MLFEWLFRVKHDEDRASAIIRYLNNVFEVKEGFITSRPQHHTQLHLVMTVIDVEVTCRDNKINFTFRGYSDNNLEGHEQAQVERVKEKVRSYLDGSHAAQWRHRVTGI